MTGDWREAAPPRRRNADALKTETRRLRRLKSTRWEDTKETSDTNGNAEELSTTADLSTTKRTNTGLFDRTPLDTSRLGAVSIRSDGGCQRGLAAAAEEKRNGSENGSESWAPVTFQSCEGDEGASSRLPCARSAAICRHLICLSRGIRGGIAQYGVCRQTAICGIDWSHSDTSNRMI